MYVVSAEISRCFALFRAVFRCFFELPAPGRVQPRKTAENSRFQRKTAEENSMNDIATLAIPANTLCRLLQYADAHPSELSAGELAAKAIEEWLAHADGASASIPRTRLQGYQWKTVFLPEGTQLRAWNRSGRCPSPRIGTPPCVPNPSPGSSISTLPAAIAQVLKRTAVGWRHREPAAWPDAPAACASDPDASQPSARHP
jgi:hypothetical protein